MRDTPSIRSAGFSLIEMLVAMAIVSAGCGILFHFAISGQRVARSQPEAADLQQRVRVAAERIRRDLLAAGSGATTGDIAGPLIDYLPPVVPARTGARGADDELSFFDDRISIIYMPDEGASPRVWTDMAQPEVDVPVDPNSPGCQSAGICGFIEGTNSLILDPADVGAGFDLFTVTGIAAGLAHGGWNRPFSRVYAAGARVLPVTHRIYYLDRANRRLMLYDGYLSDLPLVDNIVSLGFSYYADPSPTSVPRPVEGTSNCVYAAGTPPVPLLADLGGSPGLQRVTATQLTDGPVCGIAPSRFDGDLLRIRRVRVTIRAQVADDLRGSGRDVSQPGVSRSAESCVPDLEVTFDVAPRNMNPTK
jgi:prepilin-type N-terminal cleavage/methylation domain-containing protein